MPVVGGVSVQGQGTFFGDNIFSEKTYLLLKYLPESSLDFYDSFVYSRIKVTTAVGWF